ncbi:DUF418 domain-containing protein [Bacillus cereus]|uniref:DUF418 domain-containing protein n=1 Tax=Bacillus cereus TaxID=1396 RepID=UPI003525A3F4
MHFISSLLSYYLLPYKTDVYYPQDVQLWILFGGKTLAIFYICTLIRVCENKKYIECLHPLMNVGKFALTNYISQSILTLVILSLYKLYSVKFGVNTSAMVLLSGYGEKKFIINGLFLPVTCN